MDKKDKAEKINEYAERNSFWTTQALTQFSFSNNLFLTIGIGILGYLIGQRAKYGKITISCKLDPNWPLILYLIILTGVFASLFFGAICVMSRLYDMRISRHISLTRKKIMTKMEKFLPDENLSQPDVSLSRNFMSTLFTKIPFITKIDLNKYDEIKNQFNLLRIRSKLLGMLSWRAHKIQILTLIFSAVAYGLMIIVTG